MTIEEYRSRLTEIADRLKEIDAEFAGKRFDAEVKTEWNTLHAEREDTEGLIAELETRAAQVATAALDPANREAGVDFSTARPGVARGDDIYDLAGYRSRSTSPEAEVRLLQDGAMRAVEGMQFPHEAANREDVQTHVARLLDKHAERDGGALARRILATGSPLYKRAFGKQLLGQPLNDTETRALSLTTTEGGFAVPVALDPTIIPTSNGAVNPLRAISRVETISVSEWKGVTSAGVTATYRAEGAEVGDNAPTLAQPSATPERCDVFIPYSIEVGGDWSSLQTEMAALIQDAKDAVEATKFTVGAGAGSTEPEGIITGATSTVAAGTAAFAVAHLYALKKALPPRFRPNGSFLAEGSIYDLVRQFDTSGGANLWEYLGNETPDRLLGKPAWEDSAMDAVLTAGSEIMVYGDFKHFLIVDRLGMNIELVPHLFGASGRPTGQRGLLAIWRNTSDVLTPLAFRVLKTT